MLVLRILGGLLVVIVGASLLVYLVTRDRRWLRLGRQTLVFGLGILLILLVLYALERFLMVV
jgi:hypothetical protein